ncbi:hypothetical protein IC582_000946 [Cucumis melo]
MFDAFAIVKLEVGSFGWNLLLSSESSELGILAQLGSVVNTDQL